MSSEYRRKGPHLSLIERTDAVLRSLDGESHERLAEEFHVRPGQIAIWLGQWEERRSPWRSDLSPAELLAGCVVRDVEKTERNAAGIDHTRRTKSVERGPRRAFAKHQHTRRLRGADPQFRGLVVVRQRQRRVPSQYHGHHCGPDPVALKPLDDNCNGLIDEGC